MRYTYYNKAFVLQQFKGPLFKRFFSEIHQYCIFLSNYITMSSYTVLLPWVQDHVLMLLLLLLSIFFEGIKEKWCFHWHFFLMKSNGTTNAGFCDAFCLLTCLCLELPNGRGAGEIFLIYSLGVERPTFWEESIFIFIHLFILHPGTLPSFSPPSPSIMILSIPHLTPNP